MCDKTTKGIDQHGLTWRQGLNDLHQLSTGFSNSPVLRTTLSVSIKTFLPLKVFWSGSCRRDVRHIRVVVQQMLCPPTLATARWSADQNQTVVDT